MSMTSEEVLKKCADLTESNKKCRARVRELNKEIRLNEDRIKLYKEILELHKTITNNNKEFQNMKDSVIEDITELRAYIRNLGFKTPQKLLM